MYNHARYERIYRKLTRRELRRYRKMEECRAETISDFERNRKLWKESIRATTRHMELHSPHNNADLITGVCCGRYC